MQKMTFYILIVLVVLYVVICGTLYLFQEKLIFFPEKLEKDFQFKFNKKFEELSIKTHDNLKLDCLLFKADNARGVIFYLHGNAGSLNSWGEVGGDYADLNYDVFMPHYRGYG